MSMTIGTGTMTQTVSSIEEYLASEDEFMFYWDPSGFKPPEELMSRAIQVYISDPKERHGVNGRNIKNWARANCKSFFWYDVTDVSDTSYTTDEIHVYFFIDEKDVTLFQLRWGGERH